MSGQRPFWSARRPMLLGLVTLVVLVAGFGAWGTLTSLSGAIVASGRIEVELNRQVVQHPDGGVVAEIDVVEGAAVVAGDVLIRLDGTLVQSEHTIVVGQLDELTARRARLVAERDGLDAPAFPAELSDRARTDPEVADLIDGQKRPVRGPAEHRHHHRRTAAPPHRADHLADRGDGCATRRAADPAGADRGRTGQPAKPAGQGPGAGHHGAGAGTRRGPADRVIVGELTATRAQAEGRITEIELEISRLASTRIEDAEKELRDIGPAMWSWPSGCACSDEQIARLDIRAPVAASCWAWQ